MPTGWSYGDLVFLRLLAWLRQRGMERSVAADQVARVRAEIQTGKPVRYLYASSRALIAAGEMHGACPWCSTRPSAGH